MVTKKPQMSNASVRVALQETFGKLSLKKKKKRKEKKQVKKKYTVETLSQPVHAHTNIFNPISLKIPENC